MQMFCQVGYNTNPVTEFRQYTLHAFDAQPEDVYHELKWFIAMIPVDTWLHVNVAAESRPSKWSALLRSDPDSPYMPLSNDRA